MSIEVLGFVAGILTATAFVPQVYRAFKTRKTQDISWGLLVLYFIGIFLWLIYGIFKNDAALIFANAVSLVMSTLLIAAKISYGKET